MSDEATWKEDNTNMIRLLEYEVKMRCERHQKMQNDSVDIVLLKHSDQNEQWLVKGYSTKHKRITFSLKGVLKVLW